MLKIWLKRCALGAMLVASFVFPPAAQSAAPAIAPRPHGILGSLPAGAARRILAAGVPSNITTADAPIARPDTKPCTVELFEHIAFEDFSPKPFSFTPAPGCRGPWSKVVLTVALSVTAGTQYDRTAEIGLGGATIFFGTTAEPFTNEGPAWTVARDLTDLSALFTGPQAGQVSIDNLYNATYNGIIYGSAKLEFYPPDAAFPAPRVADMVVPLADPSGNAVGLSTSASRLDKPFIAPTNIERAYLDVIAQSQSQDEFWYTCVPNDLATPLNDCGNTSFRETDAFVDGRPAGVAPVYPWIYTGGIDPFLWAPTPGVQTLNFVPYRVDLTPFAAALDSGGTHHVSLGEFNSDNYFAVTANLLLFLDPHATQPLTGGLDTDTLAATPPETVVESGTFAPNGSVLTKSIRSYRIAGHLTTSHGPVRTQIDTSLNYTQNDAIVNSATEFEQTITQDTSIQSHTLTTGADASSTRQEYDFPLNLVYDYSINPDGSSQQFTKIQQGYAAGSITKRAGRPDEWNTIVDYVQPHDTLLFDASGNFTGFHNAANSQVYKARNSAGLCYGRRVAALNLVVTSNAAVGCNGEF